ncbi:PAS domain-containing sensor histidine kinase [Salipiger sp. IMCC34102]|uniref:PAS domain-containing sensor histidine kinase n=1 Tax=Salipiger sp. IMCC34102 TaxID=2510647 RepID=UPI00101D8B17|nr:ATP-binding protein [Salipiger sp. IMCC34102]RYH00935.1 PAS domain-containing sensor histidine kinase [Salipiger sp. IMCC34102]
MFRRNDLITIRQIYETLHRGPCPGGGGILHMSSFLKDKTSFTTDAPNASDTSTRSGALLDAVPDPVLAIAADTFDVVYANPAALRLFEWNRSANRSLADLGLGPEEIRLRTVLSSSDHTRREIQVARDAKLYRIDCQLLSTAGTADDDQVILTIWSPAADIDRNRRDHEFVATVSHELRTPVTSIKGALGLVLSGASGPVADKTRALLDIAHRNAGRLLLLVNDILDIEKLTSGNMSFDKDLLDLVAVLDAAHDATASFAHQFEVRIEVEAPKGPVMATIDGARIHQVLTNLISNACKFSHPGGVVTLSLDDSDPEKVRICVDDTGVGIPQSALHTIFDRFNQAQSGHRNRTGSTGLGLAIVKTIVEAHGGTISLDSVEGQGTRACFTLSRPAPE